MGKQTVEAASSSNLLMLVLAQQSIGRPLSSEKHFSLKVINFFFLLNSQKSIFFGIFSRQNQVILYRQAAFSRILDKLTFHGNMRQIMIYELT